jgi:hypothetical protein
MPLLGFLLLFSGWGVVASGGEEIEAEVGGRTRIALDLMDLEIPGEGSGDEMELPPIQGSGSREETPVPPEAPSEPVTFERPEQGIPERTRSVQSPSRGLAPFLLDEPVLRGEGARPETAPSVGGTSQDLTEEFPAELKTVPPPPSRAESLKLLPGMDVGGADRSDVPEIPLLKGEDWAQQPPASAEPDSSLTMKPFPDLRGLSETSPGVAGSSPKERRQEDYLQAREDIDKRLIDLFERYYKDR